MRVELRVALGLIVAALASPSPALAQTGASTTAKKSPVQSAQVTVRGVLLRADKTPVVSEIPSGMVFVTVLVLSSEGEKGTTSVELTDEALNNYTAQPDAKGRFSIKMNRQDPSLKGKKLTVAAWGQGFDRVQPLRVGDKIVAFEIEDKTTVVDLGRIVVTKE